ncbi:MAG: hypothetical protein IPN15_15920 [Saprospiraceae bacterium]|nr:hypothetical protein [Candidatus Vicinibacter affinis]
MHYKNYGPNGYISDNDKDEDYYPDDFEDMYSLYGFNKNVKEPTYNSMYKSENLQAENSVTYWQEEECRKEGHSRKSELNDYGLVI